jgi:hypothetical protein
VLLQYLLFVTQYQLQIVLCSNFGTISFQSRVDNLFGTHATPAFTSYHSSDFPRFFHFLEHENQLQKLHMELKSELETLVKAGMMNA